MSKEINWIYFQTVEGKFHLTSNPSQKTLRRMMRTVSRHFPMSDSITLAGPSEEISQMLFMTRHWWWKSRRWPSSHWTGTTLQLKTRTEKALPAHPSGWRMHFLRRILCEDTSHPVAAQWIFHCLAEFSMFPYDFIVTCK